MIRSLVAIILTITIALTGFTRPAYAFTPDYTYTELASIPFLDKALEGAGTAFGGVVGVIAACYIVDVLIVPVAPPVAAYGAGVCSAIGATVGGAAGGFASTKAAEAL